MELSRAFVYLICEIPPLEFAETMWPCLTRGPRPPPNTVKTGPPLTECALKDSPDAQEGGFHSDRGLRSLPGTRLF